MCVCRLCEGIIGVADTIVTPPIAAAVVAAAFSVVPHIVVSGFDLALFFVFRLESLSSSPPQQPQQQQLQPQTHKIWHTILVVVYSSGFDLSVMLCLPNYQ